jgi:ergothioneine biosynthesis protein EgtB
LYEIGHDGQGFAFDNESPRHRVLVRPFELATRLVTWGEYARFIEAGGYACADLWLSDGWAAVQANGWRGPAYVEDGTIFTLDGARPVDVDEPVVHVSYYEADAYARWAGARLPLEAEWEIAACSLEPTSPVDAACGAMLEDGPSALHPEPARGAGLAQMFGDAWEWTASAYTPYPGFRSWSGALGEYNGKFMVNRMVLRGGSCATPKGHIRATYRNYFAPDARWQFTGIRLARLC